MASSDPQESGPQDAMKAAIRAAFLARVPDGSHSPERRE